MKQLHSLAIAVVVLLTAAYAGAQDAVRIEIERGMDKRIAVAVPAFATADPALESLASDLADTMAYDLAFSGLFKRLPKDKYPTGFVGLPLDVNQLDRSAWRDTEAEYLVFGVIAKNAGMLVGRFRLFDLYSMEQLVGQELRVAEKYPGLLAHRFSEEIIRYTDGVPGIGTTEIVFSGGETGKKEIYLADYDGRNARRVTEHGSISINPVISPDGQRIAYMSYKDRYSYLYVYDRQTGKSVPLSKEVGLNAAAAWAPDGKRIAMTLSKDGNTEIYLRDPDGGNPVRLTDNRYGDTSPTFSPDGSRIAFVSDRGGNAQIYVMNADGSNQERLSYQGGSAYDPEWSPDGDSIAYVAEKRGEGLEIYVMEDDGSNARRITDSHGSNENPSWSPDSRHLAFMSTRTGRAQLWTVTLESGQQQPVPNLNMRTEGPSWGPRRR